MNLLKTMMKLGRTGHAPNPVMDRFAVAANPEPQRVFSGHARITPIAIATAPPAVLWAVQGGVVLEGNQFVWSNKEQTGAGDHLKTEARNLSAAAL
jgi:hypothetical protein